MDWTQAHRSPRTYRWYKDLLQGFTSKYPTLRLREAKPKHLEDWASEGRGERAKIVSLTRAMMDALKREGTRANPFAVVERPDVAPRDELITPEDSAVLLSNIKDQCFRDLVEFSWETGCRPHEAHESKILEAAHIDLDKVVCIGSTRSVRCRLSAVCRLFSLESSD